MIDFAQLPTGAIKIGSSGDVDARLASLQQHCRKPLALLATIPGGLKEEREIQGRFAHLRLGRTEQFQPGPDLLEFIGRPLLVDANPDAVEVTPPAQYVPVKIDADVVRVAKIAAAYEDMSLAEYISERLRPLVAQDVEQEHAKQPHLPLKAGAKKASSTEGGAK